MIQKAAGQRIPLNRHMERYPMSSSDLLSSNSSDDEDVRDLIYRNIRFNSSIEKPFRMPSIIDEFSQRPPDIRPHSMQNTCIKCNRIRTNPKYRYSYTSCRSSKLQNNKRFSTSDGQYENSNESSEDECKSHQRRAFQSNRRRIKFKNQLR